MGHSASAMTHFASAMTHFVVWGDFACNFLHNYTVKLLDH